MVSPLVPFLTGATAQYLADEDASDRLKGDIIDGVSKQLYEVEIPEAQKQINNIKTIKNNVKSRYGEGVAEAFDNIGLFESADQRLVDNEIQKYFKNLEDNNKGSEDDFKSFVNDLYGKSQLAGEEGAKAASEFKSVFGGQSALQSKVSQLKDRKEKVRELFNDRSNMRDLLVAPDAPQEGVRGLLFGDRVTPADVPGATGRLTEATQVDTPEIADRGKAASLADVGFTPAEGTGEVFDASISNHRTLAGRADSNFDQMFKDPNLGTYNFTFKKDNNLYDTAQKITDGYKEARERGYQLGLVDYARDNYIRIVLESYGITGYMSSVKPMQSTVKIEGTAPDTQTGDKVTESQIVLGSEDVGAISAKAKDGATAKEAKDAVEKTEKVSIPKTTEISISTGDSAPDPSELNQNAPGLKLANDGMLYSKGKAVKMYAPLEREIEEAQAIAFQIKSSDLSDEEKQERLNGLRSDFLQTISGMGITQYKPAF